MQEEIYRFIEYMKSEKGLSNNTVLSYQQDMVKFFGYLEQRGITSFETVKDTQINSYMLELEKRGLSSSTIARNVGTIKALFLYLTKQHIIDYDPSEKIHPPRIEKKSPKILSREEVIALLEAPEQMQPRGLRDKAMFEVMYATGLRVSELIELKCSDIDFIHRIIVCRARKKERCIPFGSHTTYALEQYMSNGRPYMMNLQEHDMVFVNQYGRALTRQGFWKIIKEYAIKVGIEEISPQSLRNSFANHMIENGADVGVVGEFLGYADPSQAVVYRRTGKAKGLEEYQHTHPRR